MGIDYDAMKAPIEEMRPVTIVQPIASTDSSRSSTFSYTTECIQRIEAHIGESLIKQSRSAYCTSDRKKGYVFCSSKSYIQGQREKYWFGYRKTPFDDISDCQEQFVVYGCKNANEVLLFPLSIIDGLTDRMNCSVEEDGAISHWHIVFLRDSSGHMTHLLSRPELTEMDIDGYKI